MSPAVQQKADQAGICARCRDSRSEPPWNILTTTWSKLLHWKPSGKNTYEKLMLLSSTNCIDSLGEMYVGVRHDIFATLKHSYENLSLRFEVQRAVLSKRGNPKYIDLSNMLGVIYIFLNSGHILPLSLSLLRNRLTSDGKRQQTVLCPIGLAKELCCNTTLIYFDFQCASVVCQQPLVKYTCVLFVFATHHSWARDVRWTSAREAAPQTSSRGSTV